MTIRNGLLLIAMLWLPISVGCGDSSAQFPQNKIATRVVERQGGIDEGLSRDLYQQIANIQAALFGTPDAPHFVAGGAEVGFIDIDNLVMAAGPVSSGRLSGDIDDASTHLGKGRGLYRQHCVHCHGIAGDGKGPTAAFLKPYPRDFTLGKFKFNSTRVGLPSTHDDLHRILMNGINGTAMPSFALLDRGEIEALVDYVKYLGVRGQTERFIVEKATEVPDDEQFIPITADEIIGDADGDGVAAIVESWKTVEPAVEPSAPNVPLVSESSADWSDEEKQQLFASIDRGRDLYYTVKANCFSCHGNTQLGDGNLGLYDDWSKELHNWQSEQDEDGSKRAEYLALGGLEPRIIRPRNLRLGQYRGGRRPLDIFFRIYNGIDGAGMPAVNGLAHDEIWDLVNFVLWIPYEKLSHPSVELQTLDRARD